MKKITSLLFATILIPTFAMAGALGGYFSHIDTEDGGESDGFGGKLVLNYSESASLDIRAALFDDFENIDDLELIPVEIGLTFFLGKLDQFRPYLGLGAGYYLLDSELAEIDDEIGWYGTFGLQLPVADTLSLFVEGQYRQIEGTYEGSDFDLDNFNNDRADLDLEGLSLNAGILFVW